jgi:FAD/FMN-containing dehydrogenase
MLTSDAIKQLQVSPRATVIRQGDPDYDAARAVYNGMIDRHPAIIVRCANVADVISAVNFARQNKLAVAIRGGGHNGGGLGTVDNGLVIDLKDMHGIQVDPVEKRVRVEGGATWGEVDYATHPFGLATPSGIVSSTGVGGLTLGGGLGHLSRKYGLTIDNLLEVDMVLADGSFITASSTKHADLFWAVRGGGGNFGVVTNFLFRLNPVDTVYAGPMLWELDKAADVMRFYRDFITKAPEDINGFFAFLSVPPGPPFPEPLYLKKMVGIVWCYTGPMEKAEAVFKPIRQFGPPVLDFVGQIPYPALQSMFTPLFPPGQQWYWKADFVNELNDEAIALHIKHGSQMPTWQSTMHLYPINGAVHRVGKQETAFSYRDSTWGMVIAGIDPDPANKDKITQWAKDYWTALHPYSAGGAYVNMMMDNEGQERVQASYRENYARLAGLKKKYDPTNFFHVNQNIQPK